MDAPPFDTQAPSPWLPVTPIVKSGLRPANYHQCNPSREPAMEGRDVNMVPATKPSLASLPDDVIMNIMSYLPRLPSITNSGHLKEAYTHLSLARMHPRFASLSRVQTKRVRCIDPFPYISHAEPPAHLPPYARPAFLHLLLALCRNVDTLHAPFIKGVLHLSGPCLRDLAFVDTGLTVADLARLATSSLTCVAVTKPSRPVLSALANVKTLNDLSLVRVHEAIVPYIIAFLSCTALSSLFIDFDTKSDDPLLSLLGALPSLQSFVLKCEVHQMWWALRYLRWIAVRVSKVEILVDGVRIRVQKLEPSSQWETSIMRRVVCRKDMGAKELESGWRQEMSLIELDLEAYDEASARGVSQFDIDRLLYSYGRSHRNFEGITARFGRTMPCFVESEVRSQRISRTDTKQLISTLVISQDVVLYARTDREHWLHKLLSRMLYRFSEIFAMQLCRPSQRRIVSARFVMALPNFLKAVMLSCPDLKCVYLEDAGELVLQTAGIPVMTDQSRLRELLRGVIAMTMKMEADNHVEMGTVIAQLDLWVRRELRVVDGRDCDDIVVIPQGFNPSQLGIGCFKVF